MIVNVLVYIVGRKDVKRVAKVNFPRNDSIAFENRKKVCGTKYGVHMDNGHDPVSITVNIRLDNPHTIVGVRVIKRFAEVVDEGTRKNFVPHLKRE